MPGKRLSCVTEWEGQTVFTKLFFDPDRVHTHWQREEDGVRALTKGKIATPKVLYSGFSGVENIRVHIFEYLADGISFKQRWDLTPADDRLGLILALAQLIADHHEQGICQNDLHLDNFFCVGEQIYTLDGASIKAQEKPLDHKASMNNIALLFAQLPVECEQWIDEVYQRYLARRGWKRTPNEEHWLQRAIVRQRILRQRHLFKRIMRTCRDFKCLKSWDNFTVYDQSYNSLSFHQFLTDIDRYIDGGKLLKRGNSATVAEIKIGGRKIVVKRYNIKSPLHAANRALRKSRASIAWRNAHRLLFYDIATPKPIALIEQRWGPIRKTSYFISESITGPDAEVFFSQNAPDLRPTQIVADSITALIRKLELQKISHGDLKATNFLIEKKRALLIDLDAMREHTGKSKARRRHRRDLKRFFKNWVSNTELTELFKQRLS